MIFSLLLLMHGVPADGPKCDQAKADMGIQQEMNICAAEEYRAADKALNIQWKATYEIMKKRDRALYSFSPDAAKAEFAASLLSAQRAWITFRDAQCRVEGNVAFGGSLQPLLVSTCQTRMTEKRTEELKKMVSEP